MKFCAFFLFIIFDFCATNEAYILSLGDCLKNILIDRNISTFQS